MLLWRREDFEPATEAERATALYSEGYMDSEDFQRRIDALRGRFTPNGQKLAIWGSGPGYLVRRCVEAGYDAFGFDASPGAIQRGKELMPSLASRLFVRNALVAGDMTPARRDAGLTGNQRFALLVTEDMLTCLNDPEIPAALTNLRGISTTNLLHMVLPRFDDRPGRDSRCNWKTLEQWRTILCPPDVVYDAETHRVWNAVGEVSP